jgi:tyrosyl-tRNA synthetase
MFGKVMSIPDALMPKYYRLCTALPVDEVDALEAELGAGTLHPNALKRRLAREIVATYHPQGAAEDAEEAFDRVFKQHQAPEEVNEIAVDLPDEVHLPWLLTELGLASSTSEGRRLIDGGGVRVDGLSVEPRQYNYARAQVDNAVIQVGKRRFARPVSGS